MNLIHRSHEADLLVIGTSIDRHIDAVLNELPDSVRPVRLDIDRFPAQVQLSVALTESATRPTVLLSDSTRIVDLSNVGAVWFRRLGAPQLSPDLSNPGYRSFALGEVEAVISGLAYVLRGAQWVSPFDAVIRARSKLLQLQLADDAGFRTPRTVVTNSPTMADVFFKSEQKALYKTLNAPSLTVDDQPYLIFSHLLDENHMKSVDRVAYAPCQFQEYIDKQHELRITFTGDDFFSVVVHSQTTTDGRVDWRAAQKSELRYTATTIPDDVSRRLRSLLDVMELRYGAIDLIVTPDNEFVFLEVNPHGAWLWLEQELGLPISASLANNLASMARRGANAKQ